MKIKFNHEIEYEKEEYQALTSTVSSFLSGLIGIGSTVVTTHMNTQIASNGHRFEMEKMKAIHNNGIELATSEQVRHFEKLRFQQEQKLEELKEQHEHELEKTRLNFEHEQDRISQTLAHSTWKPEVEEENYQTNRSV